MVVVVLEVVRVWQKLCKNIENYKKCKPLRGEKLKEMEEYLKELN